VNPSEFYKQAERSFSDIESSEAVYRSIIHLCYYAVFHECAQLLKRSTYGSWDRVTHAGIKDLLKGHTSKDPIIYRANRMFKGLYALRVKSDYNLLIKISRSDAEDALTKADYILKGS